MQARKEVKRSEQKKKIPTIETQNGKLQKKNMYEKNIHRKNSCRRRSYHGQKLFGFVMLCCLSLFLYAFLVVKGYWTGQGSWSGNDQSNIQSSETENADDSLEVHFIDVGQGDATLIKCEGETLLIDAAGEDKGTALRYYLMKEDVEKLNYLVLTHPDSDHIGSADVILTKFPVENVIMSYYERESTSYRNLKQTLDYKQITPQIAEAGQSFEVGNARCTVLGPLQKYETPNDASVILLVEHGACRFLFTGDAEVEAEEALLKDTESLQAGVYKAGHHGSSTSSTGNFLDAVNPAYAVISCAKGNEYGHPHGEVLERFEERNIQVYRTDEQGTIVAVSNGREITWEIH